MRMRYLLGITALIGLASCTPPELSYCQKMNAPPNELDKCTAYYFQQETAFNADLAVCSAEADQTYPPTLYSGWGTARVHGGMYGGRWYSGESISVPPDYQQNAQLDELRLRIIEPCMQKRGWNSGVTWEAGRRTPALTRKSTPLPWQ
jgi:hypothetical protein